MRRVLILAASAAMALSGSAFAQSNGDSHRDDRNNGGEHNSGERFTHHGRWNQGGRLPEQFHHSNYIVNNYSDYGWEVPPYGYAYYRTDTGDFVMAAIATGIIASVIASQ